MEWKINDIFLQLLLFIQNAARIENFVQTLAQAVAAQTTKITNIEQIVGSLVLWKQMQLLVPVALIQQDLGTCLDRVTAPQPLGPSGPMALGRPMTIGIQDVDLILLQALKTNMHGVPSYYDSHGSNTTLELRIVPITFRKIKHSSL